MLFKVMSELLLQYSKVLELLIDSLMAHANPLLHLLLILPCTYSPRAFDILRTVTPVAVTSFRTFTSFQHATESITEDGEIIPSAIARKVRTSNPHNVRRKNADGHFVPETWTHKLLAVVSSIGSSTVKYLTHHLEINTINRNQAVIADVISQSVLPKDLYMKDPSG
jgi:hypothetical protein